MENQFKSQEIPIQNIIKDLDLSRNEYSERLAKNNLEIIRTIEDEVIIRDLDSKQIKQEFKIETLQDSQDERLNKAYEFLADTFGANEMDTIEAVKDQMNGLRYGQKIETGGRAVIFTISKKNEIVDENGEIKIEEEVVGVLDGGVISLEDEHGNSTGECILMVYYVASKTSDDPSKNYRQLGLGRELLISAYKYATEEAKSRGVRLFGAAGECTYTSRAFWERMGWKRVYTQDNEVNSKDFKEIAYIQPPLNYDLTTGDRDEDSGEAREHLMVNIFDNYTEKNPQINKKISSIVKGFYKTNNYISPAVFGLSLDKNTKELKSIDINMSKEEEEEHINAYKKHLSYVNPLLDNFTKQMDNKKVRLLTEEQITKEGLNVEDYITGEDELKMLEEKSEESDAA